MNDLFRQAGMTVFERGWLSSNNVLFDAGEGAETVLVDSGYWSHSDQTIALVSHALGGRPLDRLVNTHLHSDHCGGNFALQLHYDCHIAIPAGEADKVDRWDEDALTYRATGQTCPRFTRDALLVADSEIMCGAMPWRVIASPGHDPESMVLYQPDLQILISADALWNNGFGVVFPELAGESGFDDVRATLERLSMLQVRWVIPGHGAPFEDMDLAIDRAHSRLDAFMADPVKHARYAAKVLIKYHLMDNKRVPFEALMDWALGTAYMNEVNRIHFGAAPIRSWIVGLIDDLIASKALARSDGFIVDA